MSVSFNGLKASHIVRTPAEMEEDSVGFNLNQGNAAAFLRLLQIDCFNESGMYGSLSMPVMVQKVQQARASFDYRVDVLVRKASERMGARGCRVFEGGVDEEYFTRRLNEFAELLADWIELGADSVTWG